MKHYWRFLNAGVLVLALFISPIVSGDEAIFRAMTINAEWLWTPFDRRVDGKKVKVEEPAPKQYREELAFYAGLIKTHQIDLLAISEIENGEVASDLAKTIGGGWKSFFRQGRDTATGQDVAILTRLNVRKGSATDFGFPTGRIPGIKGKKRLSKILGLSLVFPEVNAELPVVTSHFLSRRNNSKRKTLNRVRQAYALLESDHDAHRDGPWLLLGDLNAVSGSETIKVMRQQGNLQLGLSDCQRKNPMVQKRFAKMIDHVLFRKLSCREIGAISLAPYSDHPAVYVELRLIL